MQLLSHVEPLVATQIRISTDSGNLQTVGQAGPLQTRRSTVDLTETKQECINVSRKTRLGMDQNILLSLSSTVSLLYYGQLTHVQSIICHSISLYLIMMIIDMF